jgi:hypothetical protein
MEPRTPAGPRERTYHDQPPLIATPADGELGGTTPSELRARDITVNRVAPGLEPPGTNEDIADLIALLDQWRGQPRWVMTDPRGPLLAAACGLTRLPKSPATQSLRQRFRVMRSRCWSAVTLTVSSRARR